MTAPEVAERTESNSSWFIENVAHPFANAAILEPWNAVASVANAIHDDALPEFELLDAPPASGVGWLAQSLSSGVGGLLPFVVAGELTGSSMRGTGRLLESANLIESGGLAFRGLSSERLAMITGAGIYGAAQKPRDGQTRLGNAAAALVGMSVYELGGKLTEGTLKSPLPSFGNKALIGFAGGATAAITDNSISSWITTGRVDVGSLNSITTSGVTGAAFNMFLPVARKGVDSLEPGVRMSPPASNCVIREGWGQSAALGKIVAQTQRQFCFDGPAMSSGKGSGDNTWWIKHPVAPTAAASIEPLPATQAGNASGLPGWLQNTKEKPTIESTDVNKPWWQQHDSQKKQNTATSEKPLHVAPVKEDRLQQPVCDERVIPRYEKEGVAVWNKRTPCYQMPDGGFFKIDSDQHVWYHPPLKVWTERLKLLQERSRANGMHYEIPSLEKCLGWKIHLNLPQDRLNPLTNAIADYCEQKKLSFKIGHGGIADEGKAMTVYIGDRETMEQVATELDAKFGALIPAQLEENMKCNERIVGNIWARFDAAETRGPADKYQPYGPAGLCILKRDVESAGYWSDHLIPDKLWKDFGIKARKALIDDFGVFFAGTNVE